ncbi:MAG: cbb3-type cytochrome oxidase subunit 3 [Burkholderiales bacterium]
MDINLLRSLITAVLFAVFIGIVMWAWSKGRREDFEAAARLPLEDDRAEQEMARNGKGLQ